MAIEAINDINYSFIILLNIYHILTLLLKEFLLLGG
jgi:hypothetical protein